MRELLNLRDFTPAQHACYLASTLCWLVTYVLVARNAVRHRWLGLPPAALVANLGWEIAFSTVITTRLGPFYVWGARLWLLFDLALFALLLVHGRRQVRNPLVARWFTPIVVAGVALWTVAIYAFVKQFDDAIGGYTGYLLNVMMSVLFIFAFLEHPEQPAYSLGVAVWKMLGTVVILLAELAGPRPGLFVVVVGVITLLLDFGYLALVARRQQVVAALARMEPEPETDSPIGAGVP